MTVRAMVVCNGSWPGRPCRGYLPVAATGVAKARAQAVLEGWSHSVGSDYCPACTRRRVRIAEAKR